MTISALLGWSMLDCFSCICVVPSLIYVRTELLCLFLLDIVIALLDIVIALLLFSPVISHHMTRTIRAIIGYFGCQLSVVLYPNN